MKGIINAIAYAIVITMATVVTAGLALFLIAPAVFFTFAGASGRAEKASKIVQTTLMADEVVVVQAIQFRIFALFKRRTVAAITNSRIMIVQRGLFGGFKMSDIQWKDLKDAKLEQNILENLCGSNVYFRHLNAGVGMMGIEGVPSDIASQMYSRAQSEEHAWEEKRRVRAMEEVRAAAGGVVVHAPATTPIATSTGGNRMLNEIQEAKKLHDAGVISDSEFQEMKSKILASA